MHILPFLVFLNLVTIILALLMYRNTNILRRETSDLLGTYLWEEQETYSDEDEISTQEELMYEEFLAERNAKFEERITRIKDELGTQNTPPKPTTTADILHPHVENLPHDSIPDYETNLPSVEYAD